MVILTDDQKQQFIENGVLIIRDLVPESMIQEAFNHADTIFLERSGKAHEHEQHKFEIKDLYNNTSLAQIAEELLGEGNTKLLGDAQIAFTPRDDNSIKSGMKLTDAHPSHKWHVDASRGKYAPLGADFLILCGVALSEGQDIDENRGQFIYFPGSHIATHQRLKELIETVSPSEVMQRFRTSKPAVGPAVRGLLRPGDVILVHQRLAHCPGFNLCDVTRINVYFRVTRINFEHLVFKYVRNPLPWLGFDGLFHLLPNFHVESEQNEEENEEDFEKQTRNLLSARCIGLPQPILSDTQIGDFIENGYLILSGFVNEESIKCAQARIKRVMGFKRFNRNSKWLYVGGSSGVYEITRAVRLGGDFMQLMLKTGLVDVCEQLLGQKNIVVEDGIADVFCVPRSDDEKNGVKDSDTKKKWDLNDTLPKHSWNVCTGRGRFKSRGFDHLIRVGVALSDGMEVNENRGQLIVWPGSHFKTHEMIRKIMQENDGSPSGRPFWQARKRLDCGEPERLVLKTGDAYILHQRLATGIGANATDNMSKFTQFRIGTVNMDQLFDKFNYADKPFTGFEGLTNL